MPLTEVLQDALDRMALVEELEARVAALEAAPDPVPQEDVNAEDFGLVPDTDNDMTGEFEAAFAEVGGNKLELDGGEYIHTGLRPTLDNWGLGFVGQTQRSTTLWNVGTGPSMTVDGLHSGYIADVCFRGNPDSGDGITFVTDAGYQTFMFDVSRVWITGHGGHAISGRPFSTSFTGLYLGGNITDDAQAGGFAHNMGDGFHIEGSLCTAIRSCWIADLQDGATGLNVISGASIMANVLNISSNTAGVHWKAVRVASDSFMLQGINVECDSENTCDAAIEVAAGWRGGTIVQPHFAPRDGAITKEVILLGNAAHDDCTIVVEGHDNGPLVDMGNITLGYVKASPWRSPAHDDNHRYISTGGRVSRVNGPVWGVYGNTAAQGAPLTPAVPAIVTGNAELDAYLANLRTRSLEQEARLKAPGITR